MILETTFLVDLLRGNAKALEKLKELQQRKETQLVTAPTIHELWRGIIRRRYGDQQRQKIEETLAGIMVLGMTAETAKRSGEIEGKLANEGSMIDPEDCMIAGIALHNKESVLTNDEHFRLIEGLKVERY